MSENGGDEASASKKTEIPSKPPRPPPPSNCPKMPRPSSIQHHLDQLQGLKPDRVRWFVKEDKQKWTPFNGSDSLAIEHCYQQILVLESRMEDSTKPLNTSSIYDMPTVKGDLYEVDVVARQCTPIYWKDKSLPVCRGTWFTGSTNHDTWQPLCEEDCEQIELSHQSIWRSMGLQVGPVENERGASQHQGLGRLKLKGFYVEWSDLTDVWLYWDDVKSRIIRNVGEKIGFSSGAATQLHRGYHTSASPDDKPQDISHLVFVVHGIGQLLHMSNIVKSCADIRKGVATVLERQFPDGLHDQRVEFIPVEWRSSLKLDEGTIESITPTSVSGLRKVLNTSMMDIMYYTSPFYRYEIIDGVRDEMILLYNKFCSRNPLFLERNGKISIVAHSLGSVIAYDILTLWDIELRHLSQDATGSTGFLTESLQYLRSVTSRTGHEQTEVVPEGNKKENLRVKLSKARSEVMKLEAMMVSEVEHGKHGAGKDCNKCPFALPFTVEILFSLGSPLAVFLALRGLRPQDDDVEDHVLPKSVCKRLVNIYHPADPVAYRLEPLISGEYSNIPPVQLHRFDSKQTGYSEAKSPSKSGAASKWGGLFRVGFSKSKTEEEASERSASPNSDENMEEDEVVIVHNATSTESRMADGAHTEAGHTVVDGSSAASSKRTGWIASLFGSSAKASTSSNSSQESEETSETDGGAKKDEQAKKEEHITVPAKVLKERLDFTLREGYMESNYWSAVTSHVSYWGSCDVARFILENCLDTTQNMDQS